jgi:hypothetical protein
MHPLARVAAIYAVVLYIVAGLNYIPGLTDEEGRTFGIFALDIYDDALHFASATWAAIAAWMGRRASLIFLTVFGSLYLADGLLGVVAGSGFLDLGIVIYGVLDQSLVFNLLASLPHIILGGVAVSAAAVFGRRQGTAA